MTEEKMREALRKITHEHLQFSAYFEDEDWAAQMEARAALSTKQEAEPRQDVDRWIAELGVESVVERIIHETFAPAIDFRAPYAKLMSAKAAKEIRAALSQEGLVAGADGGSAAGAAPLPPTAEQSGSVRYELERARDNLQRRYLNNNDESAGRSARAIFSALCLLNTYEAVAAVAGGEQDNAASSARCTPIPVAGADGKGGKP